VTSRCKGRPGQPIEASPGTDIVRPGRLLGAASPPRWSGSVVADLNTLLRNASESHRAAARCDGPPPRNTRGQPAAPIRPDRPHRPHPVPKIRPLPGFRLPWGIGQSRRGTLVKPPAGSRPEGRAPDTALILIAGPISSYVLTGKAFYRSRARASTTCRPPPWAARAPSGPGRCWRPRRRRQGKRPTGSRRISRSARPEAA